MKTILRYKAIPGVNLGCNVTLSPQCCMKFELGLFQIFSLQPKKKDNGCWEFSVNGITYEAMPLKTMSKAQKSLYRDCTEVYITDIFNTYP